MTLHCKVVFFFVCGAKNTHKLYLLAFETEKWVVLWFISILHFVLLVSVNLDGNLIETLMNHWVFTYVRCCLLNALHIFFSPGQLKLLQESKHEEGGSEEEYTSLLNKKTLLGE